MRDTKEDFNFLDEYVGDDAEREMPAKREAKQAIKRKTMGKSSVPKKRKAVKKPIKKRRPLSESSKLSKLLASKGKKRSRGVSEKGTNVTNVTNVTENSLYNKYSVYNNEESLKNAVFPKKVWLVESLIRKGFYSLSAIGKGGKTTFALQLASAVSAGSSFLGYSAKQRKTLFIELEMGKDDLQEYIVRQNLPNEPEILFPKEDTDISMTEIIDDIEILIHEYGFELVIIDSLEGLSPSIDHNDSKVIAPLFVRLKSMVKNTNASIILLDHTVKSRDVSAQASQRGSGSKSSAATGSIVLREVEEGSSKYYLDIIAYFSKKRFVIDGDEPTYLWRLLGSKDSINREEKFGDIIEAIESFGGKASNRQLAEKLSCNEGNLSRRMKRGIGRGYFFKEKEGKEVFYTIKEIK